MKEQDDEELQALLRNYVEKELRGGRQMFDPLNRGTRQQVAAGDRARSTS